MILVTGAAGKTGRSVIKALLAKGALVRALVRREDQMPIIGDLGVQDIRIGDMKSPSAMERAMQGVQAVYHICPNVSPHEVAIGTHAIRAAQSAGVDYFVFHSVLKPQTEAMPHHWNKLRVEEMLIESRLPYTILQPAAYMQNILVHRESILEKGIYPVPYPAETRLSLVDLEDVAQVAAIVLTETGHEYASYELVGMKGLSQIELVGILSEELSRPISVEVVPLEAWKRQAKKAGLEAEQIEALIKMFRYYQNFSFMGSPHVLTWLLGRSPTSFPDFAKRTMQKNAQQLND
jgi:NAD(P)H dehydrogenase (quinone)